MANCEQLRTKCCIKIAATLTLGSTDVFLIKRGQKCYTGANPKCSEKYFVEKLVEIFVTSGYYYY